MHSRWFQHPFRRAFPVSHLMRSEFPDRWLRIHSLPGSKRYPEDEVEQQIVFDRYAKFGTILLGEHAPCMVVKSRFNGHEPSEDFFPELSWTSIGRTEVDDEDFFDSWMARTVWDAARFRALLLAIADDKEKHVAFVSGETDCVFIPYDGGADGFSFDRELLQRMREEFAPWRSAHPLGL